MLINDFCEDSEEVQLLASQTHQHLEIPSLQTPPKCLRAPQGHFAVQHKLAQGRRMREQALQVHLPQAYANKPQTQCVQPGQGGCQLDQVRTLICNCLSM